MGDLGDGRQRSTPARRDAAAMPRLHAAACGLPELSNAAWPLAQLEPLPLGGLVIAGRIIMHGAVMVAIGGAVGAGEVFHAHR